MATLLYLLTFALVVVQGLACPERCYCYDDFVTCSDFTDLDLTLLPDSAETLVLTQGEMEEIPPAFFARASGLKAVEMTNFNARVVRGGAFRGLNNLDSFVIKGSSFDIVEPDGFSGVSGIAKFLISDSHFGRVGKHAFAEITDVSDWRIWSSYFASLSDEAFYAIGRVHAIQLYQNNISFIGHDIFASAYEVEYVNFYMNTINVISNGSLSHIRENADLLVVYANKFQCVCDNAWITQDPAFDEYLTSNECFFSSDFSLSESLFLLSDVNADILCPATSPERQIQPLTTTLAVLPSMIEEVDIWSDPEGLVPKPDVVQEHLYAGNVSVNNSLHESGVNMTAEFESISSPNNASTPEEWSDMATTTFSSFSVEFVSSFVDPTVESDRTSLSSSTETMPSDIPMQDSSFMSSSSSSSESRTDDAKYFSDISKASSPLSPVDDVVFEPRTSTIISEASPSFAVPASSISDSFDAMIDKTTFETLISTDVSEASPSTVVPVSSSSSSLLDNDDTSSLPNSVSSEKIDSTSFQPEFTTFSEFVDTSSTPLVVESSSVSLEQESMTSLQAHEHEAASVLSSTEIFPPLSNTPSSFSLPLSSSPVHEARSTSGASSQETFPTTSHPTVKVTSEEEAVRVSSTRSHPAVEMTPEEKAVIASSTESSPTSGLTEDDYIYPSSFASSHSPSTPMSASSSDSSSPLFSSVHSSPSAPKSSPAVEEHEMSSKHETISATKTRGSDEANEDRVEDKNQGTFEHVKPKDGISILDVITPSSSKDQEEPTATFPVELPVDLPKHARVESGGDKTYNEKAQRDKQIYARPYRPSALDMDSKTRNSATSVFSFGFLSIVSFAMSFLLSRHL